MRAALYARISTREGKQHLENQFSHLREFAKRMKWSIAKEYSDQESGASTKRPALETLLRAAAQRQFDVVAVFDLSRLTRGGPGQAFIYIERLKNSKVEFWSATEEHFRTSGPVGDLFIAIAAHIAEMERTTIRNRIRAGIERARRKGEPIGRPHQIVDRSKIATLRAIGKSIREIGRELRLSKSTVERNLPK